MALTSAEPTRGMGAATLRGMADDIVIEPLGDSEREAAVRVLARAFRDNPLDRAVIRGNRNRRLRSITHTMRLSLSIALDAGYRTLRARLGDEPLGVLVAVPPNAASHPPLPPRQLMGHLRGLLGQGIRVSGRWREVYQALEVLHPGEPHWYLSLIGVDSTHQGLGIGTVLLESWLGSIAGDGLPSYLETDREENVRFYERMGFAVRVELQVLETNVWCMRRPSESGG
jgi:ribosomal protein S18 acetylase RimI-like enzyme